MKEHISIFFCNLCLGMAHLVYYLYGVNSDIQL